MYNGLYTHDSTHKGWPVLKNAKGRYCYRHTSAETWVLNDDTADFVTGMGTADIKATEGPLPVGANTWMVSPEDVDSDWEKHTLTVTLQ